MNNECIQVKCKYIVIAMWKYFAGIKFHFNHVCTHLGCKEVRILIDNEVNQI
jgi:hypothetical protein